MVKRPGGGAVVGRPTDWRWVDRTKDPTPGDLHTLRSWENYFRRRSEDAQDAMKRLRDIQTHSTSLDLEGTWITAIWGRCDYLADQLLPELTCHQEAADALKAFRLALPDIQSDADYGLKTAREAAADRQKASAILHGIAARNAAAEQAAGQCAPADHATLRKRNSAQDVLTDAERRIRKGKGLVDEAAANFHAAATALITALNTSVQVLGTGVFEPPPPNRDQSRPPRPSMLRQVVDNELNGLYITAAYAAGVMQRTDQVGESLDEMMMFGGPETGGPASDFALADAPMSTSLANSYAFGNDPFPSYRTPRPAEPLDDGWLKRGDTWTVKPEVAGPAKGKTLRPPHERHKILGSKRGSADAENTIIPPDMYDTVRSDIQDIADGKAELSGDGNEYVVHGRRYGVEGNGTVFPKSGPGLIEMNRGEYRALQAIAGNDGDLMKCQKQFDNDPLINSDPRNVQKAIAVYSRYYP